MKKVKNNFNWTDSEALCVYQLYDKYRHTYGPNYQKDENEIIERNNAMIRLSDWLGCPIGSIEMGCRGWKHLDYPDDSGLSTSQIQREIHEYFRS